MHDSLNTSAGRVAACCDDRPDRLGAWLRRTAATLAALWYFNYCWPAGTMLSALPIMLANARAQWLHGRTAVARPSRSGGVDHGLRAVMRGLNPMVFGGDPHAAASCNAPRRTKGKQVRVVVDETSTGWVATRRAIASMFLMRWPANCSAMEATR